MAAAALFVFFEHREVNHPQRCPAVELRQRQIATQLQTQRAHCIGDNLEAVGAEEQDIAGLRIGARQIASSTSALRNLAIGLCTPSMPAARSLTFSHAVPLAP